MTTDTQRAAADRIVTLRINGESLSGLAEPRMLLSDFIREQLGLTGTKVGCEHGVCGACTVRVDGELTRSCLVFAVQVDGAEVRTVEGFTNASADDMHPIQEAFRDCHGLQCGFCTPAMLLTSEALLEANPTPTEAEIREFLGGNVCRCTGYVGIVAAVQRASETLQTGHASTQGS